jgi:hypothetical protein
MPARDGRPRSYAEWRVKPPRADSVDLHELREHHRAVVRRLRRETERRRELEADNAHLRTVVVELMVSWYATGDRLPGMLGGSDASAFYGRLGSGLDEGDTSGDG